MPLTREELREELLAITAARKELSQADEKYLIEAFLSNLDREIDAHIDARIAARPVPRKSRGGTGVVALALIFALPLSGIAGATAGVAGLAIAWAAILLIVFMSTRR